MAKRYATEESTEGTTEKKSDRFRVGGAWRNTDKNGSNYLVAPMSAEAVQQLRAELEQYEETGCKIVSFINTYGTEEKHPDYVHYLYKKEKKD